MPSMAVGGGGGGPKSRHEAVKRTPRGSPPSDAVGGGWPQMPPSDGLGGWAAPPNPPREAEGSRARAPAEQEACGTGADGRG
eukprot:1803457-Prymnesium_polylepis.1